jgi:cytochrome c-type biogenesis protein CcmE
MKPLHIILIILSGLGVATVVSLNANTSEYVTFRDADQNTEKLYHIACKLNKSKPLTYQPEIDPNKFTFFATDSLGNEKMVIYLKSKPQDIERVEKMVIIGKSKGSYFLAETILSKCPSKYEDSPVKLIQKTN